MSYDDIVKKKMLDFLANLAENITLSDMATLMSCFLLCIVVLDHANIIIRYSVLDVITAFCNWVIS